MTIKNPPLPVLLAISSLAVIALFFSCGDQILDVVDPGQDPPPSSGDPPPTGGDPPPTGGDPPPTGGDPPPTGGDPPPPGAVVVSMQDDFFLPREVTVMPGDTITWQNDGGKPHTSTSDTGIFDSGTVGSGSSWSWTVPSDTPLDTNFPYFCIFHGGVGGQGMAGLIRVSADPPPPTSGNTVTVTTPGNTFSPERVEIQPGDTVIWEFSGSTHNVTFTNGAPPDGNIPDSDPGTQASRTFPAEGDFDYECTLHSGQQGRIRVRAP